MTHHLIFPFVLLLAFSTRTFSQSSITKKQLQSVFEETLRKSRNAVKSATNNWRYDNSKNDYFKKDTITLNSARSYKTDYCNGINWNFYKTDQFIIENVQYCNEPPTKLISKREDSIKLKIKEVDGRVTLVLYNKNGVFQKFLIVHVKTNEPLSNEGDYQFDYTMTLLRIDK